MKATETEATAELAVAQAVAAAAIQIHHPPTATNPALSPSFFTASLAKSGYRPMMEYEWMLHADEGNGDGGDGGTGSGGSGGGGGSGSPPNGD